MTLASIRILKAGGAHQVRNPMTRLVVGYKEAVLISMEVRGGPVEEGTMLSAVRWYVYGTATLPPCTLALSNFTPILTPNSSSTQN